MPDDALESLYRDRRIHRIGGCKSRSMQSNGEPLLTLRRVLDILTKTPDPIF